MRGNSPGVSSQSQQPELTSKDEQKAQRDAEDEERRRIADERTREATRTMLEDSNNIYIKGAKKPPLPLLSKAKSETPAPKLSSEARPKARSEDPGPD
eukprot:204486-Pyramimonas_sp.AAC.1